MPTVFLILVAQLMSLRLTASLEGLRIRATLHNDGPAPVAVTVGDHCAGPAFTMVVDRVERPFVRGVHKCQKARPIVKTIAPDGDYAILSDALDGRQHRVRVRFDDLSSPVVEVPTDVRVDLKLAATAHARAGEPIDLEVTHVNRSPEAVPLPICGEDRLLVDGKELPLPAVEACRPLKRMVPVRGAFVTRGRMTLPPGRHQLRARWREVQSDDVIVEVGP
jgi:hypothetical protein